MSDHFIGRKTCRRRASDVRRHTARRRLAERALLGARPAVAPAQHRKRRGVKTARGAFAPSHRTREVKAALAARNGAAERCPRLAAESALDRLPSGNGLGNATQLPSSRIEANLRRPPRARRVHQESAKGQQQTPAGAVLGHVIDHRVRDRVGVVFPVRVDSSIQLRIQREVKDEVVRRFLLAAKRTAALSHPRGAHTASARGAAVVAAQRCRLHPGKWRR